MHDDRTRERAREQGPGSTEPGPADPAAEERKIQRGVLSHVLTEQPALTSEAEIAAVLLPSGKTGFGERDNIDQAIDELVRAGLLYRNGNLLVATRATRVLVSLRIDL